MRERVSLSILYKEESVSLLNGEEADSFFTKRKECLSCLYREERVSFFYIESGELLLYKVYRASPFFIEKREPLSSI